MTVLGTALRRNFEPVMLSAQVLVDLAVLILSCWIGYEIGQRVGGVPTELAADLQWRHTQLYKELSALICAVCLVTFHAFGMYSPVKSLLNMNEFKAVVKSVIVSFFVLFTLIVYLHSTWQAPSGTLYEIIVPLHRVIDLDINPNSISRVTLLVTFLTILGAMMISRFISFRVIQALHRRGVGNRNVLIYGAGATGRKLQRKFMLVPTLGLNLVGFVDDDPALHGTMVERSRVLGGYADLERLIMMHKVSEVFVAMPEQDEARVMRIVELCERTGTVYKVVPRFWQLMQFKVRIDNLDSIPLIVRPERGNSVLGGIAKRAFDIVFSGLVIVALAPVFVLTAILIKKQSPGPVFFKQVRIGRDGQPFTMWKFRTMHVHMGGDAPTPNSPYDPRVTKIGRVLRRYSLDELPQFFNVFGGSMSVVGPRPEMRFIVDGYGPFERERLRVKPGITGLWQISYARAAAIHDNLDYDLYYIENQSFLLDLVITVLTVFAVVKGTGAY
jgi:exopolysaccharide biosynthesis polyprenyl glycosylphosphotransferase